MGFGGLRELEGGESGGEGGVLGKEGVRGNVGEGTVARFDDNNAKGECAGLKSASPGEWLD